ALGRSVVPLVEQCVESFKDKCFVLLFNRLIHLDPPPRTGVPRASELLGRFAAVDEVGSSRDEGGFVGGNKNDSLSNLIGFSHALERHGRDQTSLSFFGFLEAIQHLCF